MVGTVIQAILCCLAITVSGQTDDDPVNKMVLPQNTIDSANNIATFVGFTCPKGHRCLPVIECLPCDYGFYKDTEGSELCSHCPAGCTTLRKGAESWRECVPKCPPGYEESECSKTCTKCRPGYYKSSWDNVPCTPCPDDVIYYEDDVGMTTVDECRGNKTVTKTTPIKVTTVTSTRPTETPVVTTTTEYEDETIVCSDYPADVVFVIDGSGSIREEDFEKQLLFILALLNDRDVTSEDARARIAVVAFSDTVYDHIYLNSFYDQDQLKQRIMSIQQQKGATYTGKALEFVLNNVLQTINGDRPYAQNVVLVITDGKSTDPYKLTTYANLLRMKAYKVFAVAVGDFETSELVKLASEPQYVYTVENFDALQTIGNDILRESCADATAGCIQGALCSQYEHDVIRVRLMFGTNCTSFCHCAPLATDNNSTVTYYWERQDCAQGTMFDTSIGVCNHPSAIKCTDGWLYPIDSPPPNSSMWPTVSSTQSAYWSTTMPTTTMLPEEYDEEIVCHDYTADIVIVIDGSGSIKNEDFKKQLEFVQQIIRGLNASSRANIAVVAFSSDVYEYVFMDQYANKTALEKRIMNFTQQGYTTYTGKALKFVVEDILSAAHGDRPNAQDVVLVVTDGQSTDPVDMKKYANQLKQKASKVFAVAVGDFDASELEDIASDPAFIYHVENFDALDTIYNDLKRESCADNTAGCRQGALCSQNEHDEIRLRLMFGTNCTSYCQCAPLATDNNSTVTFYWERKDCAPGTQFDESIKVCNHPYKFVCHDGWMSGEPPTPPYTSATPSITPTPAWTEVTGEVTFPTDMPPFDDEMIECHDYSADIVIVIDGSGSIDKDDFQKQLQFVSHMVLALNASARARLAVVAFSNDAYEYVYLDQYVDRTALASRVLKFTQQKNQTYTGKALKFVVEDVLSAAHGDRPNAQDVVLVVTDGKSTDPDDMEIYADQLKQKASKVFAVGVGNYDFAELLKIASDPTYVYEVDSFDALDTIADDLKRESCADKTAGCQQGALCSQYEHNEIRLRLMFGTNCTSFCHCAPLATDNNSTVTYYWERQDCPAGTQFDETIRVCNHVGDFVCQDGWMSRTPNAQTTTFSPSTTIEPCTHYLSGYTGTVEYPVPYSESTVYPHNKDCFWYISGPIATTVTLTVYALNMEPLNSCRNDYLAVYKGKSLNESSRIGSLMCGNPSVPFDLTSAFNEMTVVFHSDNTYAGKGFYANFTAHGSPSDVTLPPVVDDVTDPTTGCPVRVCSGVEYYALPGCNGFCQCDDARKAWVQHLCNVPHELFNEDFKNCDHDYNVDPTTCTTQTIP